ncbi:uncharacterized protein K452DRAFT_299763 [Aplosporella prunicola CBS 121167]|uniref:Thiamine-triphosphatase n=1 Tax=Aplosporella prunicola CBS 121167 TaxID=1176127 RepID=A0A6A6B8I9_9PEZI|nr:uncharacterized protein K452DRAFT_299763 [Aplosporella prunicola CBS 121167]KAF2140420.1 hypothetical protein K452DRAFT_299763 [Aplosporella prunicola CBS 121167]
MKATTRLLSSVAQRCTLEVERKFRGLAVPALSATAASPPFASLEYLGKKTIRDTYYDRGNQLSARGVWLRLRDGQWQAKISRGGTYNNSRFEEVTDPEEIGRRIKNVTALDHDHRNNFGLEEMAVLTTLRETWLADGDYKIVSDTMDFGHVVGEVELERTQTFEGESDAQVQLLKDAAMKEMDAEIVGFMERYAWAFLPGTPTGKLTAYFERGLRP